MSTRCSSRLAALVCCLFAGAVILVAASGCGGASSSAAAAPASGLTDVTLIMDWVPWVLDIPVDVAQSKHYYADGGLRVKQTIPAGATDVVKFVATGRAHFGLYYAPDTLTAVGEGAPLVSVAGLMSHAPVGLAMAPGEKATTPTDLAGKVAGIVMIPSTRASFATMLKSGGVAPGAVKVADPGFEIVAPLLARKYDAVAVTQFGELVQAEAQVGPLDYLDFRDWGTPDYAFLNVITDKSMTAEHPATVSAFVAATLRGLSYAAEHPQEAVDIYVARHPELDKTLLLAQWKAATPSLATAGAHLAGWQDAQSWQDLAAWMLQSGQVSKPVPLDGLVTNAYLPAP
jgi:putative hydroxymethylpyrimidine transport system substrate-binding protein